MVRKTFELIIDTKRPMSNREFEVVSGDNGNVLVCNIFDNGEPVDLTGCRVVAVFAKTNGTSLQDSSVEGNGVSVDGNTVSITLNASSFSVGTTECELQIYTVSENSEEPDTLVTTARFNFNARSAIFGESTALSTSEYPFLIDLLNRTSTAVRDCETATQNANEASQFAGGFEFSVGTVETVPSTEPVSVVNSGTGNKIVLDFKIPRGQSGQETYCLSSVMTSYGNGNLELALFRNGEICTDTVYVAIKKKAVGSSDWTSDSITMNNGTAIYPYTNTVAIVATAFSDAGLTRVLASSSATCGAVGSIDNIYSGTSAPVPDAKYSAGDLYFQYGAD